MLERHDGEPVLEDKHDRPDHKPATAEQDETEKVSDRDYQAGFWSTPS